ncbi:class I fructose-bisphosphate aldolase, partial [Salmonella enterica]|uniref:class I fructose-bisphosphate aldolase n=1 Tax=Salmonella enterica TaxID=28901 RepID=UPI003CEC74DB
GQNYVDFLTAHRIIPGIKVDQGLAKFDNSVETYTKGLNGLDERLKEYYIHGLRFAKWRTAFEIHLSTSGAILTPTTKAIEENCRI